MAPVRTVAVLASGAVCQIFASELRLLAAAPWKVSMPSVNPFAGRWASTPDRAVQNSVQSRFKLIWLRWPFLLVRRHENAYPIVIWRPLLLQRPYQLSVECVALLAVVIIST